MEKESNMVRVVLWLGENLELVEIEFVEKHRRVSRDNDALAWGWTGLPDGGGGEVGLKCRGEEGKEGGP